MQNFKIETVSDYINVIERLRNRAAAPLWYRGVTNSSHELVPSLYRHRSVVTASDAASLENKLANIFRQRSIPYLTRPVDENPEMLFLMQHHLFPTRLLDWTENPMAALSFSTNGAPRAKKKPFMPQTKAVVWVIDPARWNTVAMASTGYQGGILESTSTELTPYLGALNSNQMPMEPVCLHGAYNSARIVAQRGVFVIFGKGLESMESAPSQTTATGGLLAAITINRSKIVQLSQRLIEFGFGDATLFPELDGLAREARAALRF